MQSNGFIALVVATVIVAAAAIALSLGGSRSMADAGSDQAVLANFASKIGDVAIFKIVGTGGTVTLQRQGQGWTIAAGGEQGLARQEDRQHRSLARARSHSDT